LGVDDRRATLTKALEKKGPAAISPTSRPHLIARLGERTSAGGLSEADCEAALGASDIPVMTLAEAQKQVAATRAALGVQVVSSRELRITLRQPTHYFLELVAFVTYMPVRQDCIETIRNGEIDEDEKWVFPERIITNGPYTLKQWIYKSRTRLERSPFYWGRDRVRLGTVDLFPIDDANTCLINYERGQLDFLTNVEPLAAERLIQQVRAGLRSDFHTPANLGTYYYRFNVTRKPLDDPRVRKALALALNKTEIVERAGRMGQPVTGSLVPPGIPGYEPVGGLGYDPERARVLLAEAGFPGGNDFPELTLLYNTSEAHKAIAELAQTSWQQELGIRLKIENVEWKVCLERMRQLDYDIGRAGWYGDYVDPNTFLDMFVTGGGNNNTGWSNAEYDELIAEAARTLDAAERMKIFRRAESLLVEQQLPILPIYHYVGTMLAKPHVRGWTPNVRNDILLQDMWVEPREAAR
jgi:oligopeptide transport system substrate-binding protein